jgi:hypothetical protein
MAFIVQVARFSWRYLSESSSMVSVKALFRSAG